MLPSADFPWNDAMLWSADFLGDWKQFVPFPQVKKWKQWAEEHAQEIVKSKHEPIAVKISNCSMGLLSWNPQITAWIIWREIINAAWAICNEIVKSQDGPLPWNCQIKAWANCRENVKLQHGPSAVKSSNYSMDHMAWNHQIAAWAICHEIVKS